MDCRRIQISLESAFNRARAWFVPLAHVCWMSVPIGMIAWGSHVAASLTVSFDFVAFRQWMRDTGRSAWWIVPFVVLPIAIIGLTIFATSLNSSIATALKLVAAGLYVWGVVEMSGVLRIARGHPIPAGSAIAPPAPASSRRA